MPPTEPDDPLRARITVHADICNGRPTIRSLRIAVATVLDLLAAGDTPEDILATYPFLEPDDIRACLAFARDVVDNRYEVQAAQ
jgi:uncharacterized protein (DUF433 family)